MCMKDDRIPKKMPQKNTRGKRPRGKPRIRWKIRLKQDTENRRECWMKYKKGKK